METAVTPPAGEVELHLLTDWAEPGRNARVGRSAVLSLVAHVIAIVFVLFMPETFMQPARPKERETIVTPLIFQRLTITQKEPNPNKTIHEFRSADLTPRIKAPAGPSPEPQAAAPKKSQAPAPKAAPQSSLPEPPKVEIAVNEDPKLVLPVQQQQQAPPPKSRPAFEDSAPQPASPTGERLPDILGPPIAGAGRGPLVGRGANIEGTAPIASSGAQLPQLLSDSQGVDFKPYLAQVLASVKRYWDIIAPSLPSVKAKRRGYVAVQFAIERDGTVRKVVFVTQTGDSGMDNATIQAISAGGPFGPLPAQFHNSEIHVMMNFSYNVPKQ